MRQSSGEDVLKSPQSNYQRLRRYRCPAASPSEGLDELAMGEFGNEADTELFW